MTQTRVQVLAAVAVAIGAFAVVTAQQVQVRRKELPVQTSSQSSAQATGSASGQARAGGSMTVRSGGGNSGFAWSATKPTYAVWYEVEPKVDSQQALSAANLQHSQYMEVLSKNQTLIVEGLFTDSTGFMAVIQADNIETATKIVKADPAVQNGVLVATLKPWQPRYRMMSGRPVPGAAGGLQPTSVKKGGD